MEYTTLIDLGQVGDVELTVEVDDDWMHEVVTESYCVDWATQHFEQCVDAPAYVKDYLDDNWSDEELLDYVAGRVGISK